MLKLTMGVEMKRRKNNTRITIEVNEVLRAQAKSQAYAEGTTLKGKIVGFIIEWLKGEGKYESD